MQITELTVYLEAIPCANGCASKILSSSCWLKKKI